MSQLYEIVHYRASQEKKKKYNSYKEFYAQWKKELFEVGKILDYLSTYPQEMKSLQLENPLNSGDLNHYQADWIKTYSQWDERETSFFEPQWITVKSEEYEYFIDLADPNYAVFAVFFGLTINKWYKIICYPRIEDLMLELDESIDANTVRQRLLDTQMKILNDQADHKMKNN